MLTWWRSSDPQPLRSEINRLAADRGTGTRQPICADDYYPKLDGGPLKQATLCPPGACDDDPPQGVAPIDAVLCQEANQTNCLPTVINDYTTSFNWAQFNFSAIWLRTRWHLVSNSFISDVQNAGLTFISGGDYTHSSAIKGLWELALKTVFVGQTQKDSDAPFASSTLNWLTCENPTFQQQLYCISKNNSFALGKLYRLCVSVNICSIFTMALPTKIRTRISILRSMTLARTPPARFTRK